MVTKELTVVGTGPAPIVYDVTDEQLAKLRERAVGVAFNNREGYEIGRVLIADCRNLRAKVEARRKELKAESLEYGRKVDAVAKQLETALASIEEPLKLAKKAIDDEAERIKREKAEAEEAARKAEYERQRAEAEAKAKAEREAEEARLAEERRKQAEERAALEAERRAFEEQRAKAAKEEAERQASERAKIEEERRKVEAERARLAAEEATRQAAARAEQEARDRIERERLEAERREVEAAELAKRREALKPDVDKVHAFAATLKQIEGPKVKSIVAKRAIEVAMQHIADAAAHLQDFSAE